MLLLLVAVLAAPGCRKPVHFPAEPAFAKRTMRAFNTSGGEQPDFFLLPDATGRVTRIGYDTTGDGRPDDLVCLDEIPLSECTHLVLILDGYGYDLMREYYDAGGLRLLHPPSRVVATYPTLTDLCLADALALGPLRAFEAQYFDRDENELAGGSGDYMEGANMPYNRILQYRAGMLWDALGYLYPKDTFGKELNDAKRAWDAAAPGRKEFLAYFVSSAGIGTKYGAAGQRESLRQFERLVLQILQETRGRVKVTVLADHGHSYTESRPIALEEHLQQAGWRRGRSLQAPKDYVFVQFGLVTYAALWSDSPAALAADAADCEGVELASRVEAGRVVVAAGGGQEARIGKTPGGYTYEPLRGDPLKLRPILANLTPDAHGAYDARALLAATATHEYPAPLQRLWRAHMDEQLARHRPDVIVSIADGWFSGAGGFAGSVKVASTHGGLNYNNSATFIQSSLGPLPPVLRSANIPAAISALTGRAFPLKR